MASAATICAPESTTSRADSLVGVMNTPSEPIFVKPITGTFTADTTAATSGVPPTPPQRIATAPPSTAARAILSMVPVSRRAWPCPA